MNCTYRYEITDVTEETNPYAFEIGMRYNLQIWVSYNKGKTWNYCGVGRFCKDMEEVNEYIEMWKKGETE